MLCRLRKCVILSRFLTAHSLTCRKVRSQRVVSLQHTATEIKYCQNLPILRYDHLTPTTSDPETNKNKEFAKLRKWWTLTKIFESEYLNGDDKDLPMITRKKNEFVPCLMLYMEQNVASEICKVQTKRLLK